jgi:hypothetical protein
VLFAPACAASTPQPAIRRPNDVPHLRIALLMERLQHANRVYIRMVEAGGTLFQALMPPPEADHPKLPGAELDEQLGRCPAPLGDRAGDLAEARKAREADAERRDGARPSPTPEPTPHDERRTRALIGLEHEIGAADSEHCK